MRDNSVHHAKATGDTEAVLHVAGLTKQFGRYAAVNDLTLQIKRGEAVALWGINGAGKTTAIRCVLGLLRCQGEIRVCGHRLRRHGKAVRRLLGYVPQEQAFYDDWRAEEVVGFFAKLKRVPRQRVGEVLEEVGLCEHKRKRITALSGGMKQRLALACALLADPPLLVLDEITASLDAAARRSFLTLLAELRERGKAILFTSHRLDEVEALADRVLVLDAGRCIADTAPNHLAETIGLRAGVRLMLDDITTTQAAEALRNAGFTAQPNGRGVYVEVNPDGKAAPIHALTKRGIQVRSFEIESAATASARTVTGDEQ